MTIESGAAMRLAVYRTMWGVWDATPATLEDVLRDTAERGYDGVETNPLLFADRDEAVSTLGRHGLALLPRVQTFGRSVDDHLDWIRRGVQAAAAFHPPWVVVQGGRDSWDSARSDAFFEGALAIEADMATPLAHETHRGRILFHPWAAARALDEFPDLFLAADYSHWVVVAERLLDHESEILERCAPRVLHIDARVGHPEGPQVTDPAEDRWSDAVSAHEAWWVRISDVAAAAGRSLLTVVPEFGSAPYRTPDAPPSDEVNDAMAARIRELLTR